MDIRLAIIDFLDQHPVSTLLCCNLLVIVPGVVSLILELKKACQPFLKLWLLILLLRLILRTIAYLYSTYYESQLFYQQQRQQSTNNDSYNNTPMTTVRGNISHRRSEHSMQNQTIGDVNNDNTANNNESKNEVYEFVQLGSNVIDVGEQKDLELQSFHSYCDTNHNNSTASCNASSPTKMIPSSSCRSKDVTNTNCNNNNVSCSSNNNNTNNSSSNIVTINSASTESQPPNDTHEVIRDNVVNTGFHNENTAEPLDNLQVNDTLVMMESTNITLLFLQKFLDIIDIFGAVWFALGNLLVFNSMSCLEISPMIFITSLSYLIFAYASFLLPVFIQCSLYNCPAVGNSHRDSAGEEEAPDSTQDISGNSNTRNIGSYRSHVQLLPTLHNPRQLSFGYSSFFNIFDGNHSNNRDTNATNTSLTGYNTVSRPVTANNNHHHQPTASNQSHAYTHRRIRNPFDILSFLSSFYDDGMQGSESDSDYSNGYDAEGFDEGTGDYLDDHEEQGLSTERAFQFEINANNYNQYQPNSNNNSNNNQVVLYNRNRYNNNNDYRRWSRTAKKRGRRRFWRHWLRHFDCQEFRFQESHPAIRVLTGTRDVTARYEESPLMQCAICLMSLRPFNNDEIDDAEECREELLVCFPCSNETFHHNNANNTNTHSRHSSVATNTNSNNMDTDVQSNHTPPASFLRHVFHARCLHDWLQTLKKSGRSLRCPLCQSLPHLPTHMIPIGPEYVRNNSSNNNNNYSNNNNNDSGNNNNNNTNNNTVNSANIV